MKTDIYDETFLARVYRTSAFLWAFLALAWLVVLSWPAAIGWTVGSAVSFGILRSLEITVRRYFVPGEEGAKYALARFSIGKLFIIIAILSIVIITGGKSFSLIVAFCAGLVLTQAVIFLKVLGMLICQYFNE